MPRSTTRSRPTKNPGYLHHKPSGQAYVRINGKCHYLGRFRSPESHRRYAALLSEFQADGSVLAKPAPAPIRPLAIAELADRFLTVTEERFGERSKNTHAVRYAMQALIEQHGRHRIEEFGPRALRTIQKRLAEAGYARSEVNRRILTIRRAVAWGVSEELVPAGILEALKAVTGLSKGQARDTAVDAQLVQETLDVMRSRGAHSTADLLAFIRWTGCRPGEGCWIQVGHCQLNQEYPQVSLEEHKTKHLTGPAASRSALITPTLTATIRVRCMF